MVLEAGCREREWFLNDKGNAKIFKYIASGDLLKKRVRIDKNYQKYLSPQGQNTTVHTTIEYQQVRDVDAKKQTVSIDLLLALKWFDPNIRTNFTEREKELHSINLRPEKLNMIWIPDLFISNQTTIKTTYP